MSERFLEDLWKRKADEEHGDTDYEAPESRAVGLFRQFEVESALHPTLAPIVENLRKAVVQYAQAVIRHSSHLEKQSDKESIANADRHRKIMHDSLIDCINQLSREYRRLGVDNNWRNDIIGQHRNKALAPLNPNTSFL